MRLLGNHESHQLSVQLLDLLDVLGLVRLVLETLEAETTGDGEDAADGGEFMSERLSPSANRSCCHDNSICPPIGGGAHSD